MIVTRLPLLFAILSGLVSITIAAPGDLDTSFAGTGFVREAAGQNSNDTVTATAIQPDGKVVALGSVSNDGVASCALARYNTDGSFDSSFDGDGRAFVKIGVDFTCGDVGVQADGKIVVVGYIRINQIYNIAVFRYNADGSPDSSFDGDGRRISAFINADFAYSLAIQSDGKLLVCGNLGDEFVLIRYNPDGSFDSSFDGDGWVATDFFGGADRAKAIAIQPDGKIVVVGNGRATGSATNDFAVARYNTDGSLDLSFSDDGKVLTDFAGHQDDAQDVVVQPDGKIAVGGNAWGTNSDLGLARYNPDGSPDTSFDIDGKVSYNLWASTEYFYEMAVLPNGKIMSFGGGNGQFALVRYNSNGSLDTSFDSDGSMVLPVSSGFSNGYSFELLADGKMVLGGSSQIGVPIDYDFTVVRLNPDATFDTSFNGDGRVRTNIHTRAIAGRGVAIQPDGKIVVVGDSVPPTSNLDFSVHRYNANGTLDTSFDGDGRVTTDFFTFWDVADAVAVQPDGKIVVVGRGNTILAIARYNPDGSLDSSFDGDGRRTESGSLDSYLKAVAIQSDGKIVVAGRKFSSGYGSVMFRYNPDGSRDTSFDGDGEVYLNPAGDDEFTAMALQPDGKIVLAGRVQNPGSFDFMTVRYNSNGSLDNSFDGDGIVSFDFAGGYDYANALKLQTDGKIVVAGGSSGDNDPLSSTTNSALARLNSDGALDSSFDGDGKIRVAISNYFDSVTGLAIQGDGKILTSGSSLSLWGNDIGTDDFALVRYHPNGSFDTTYGNNGKAITNALIQDAALDMVLDSSGRAVVAASTDGYFTVARFLGGESATSVSSPFDFDGDGKTDIGIFRSSVAEWWILKSGDTNVLAAQFGASTDRFAPADYTGDGKTDIAVWRPSSGEWYVLRSEDFSFYAFPFGSSGDIPVPADFDDDGKADAAVFRPSTASWFIKRSSDSGTTIEQFGANGDHPVPADYDGDGRADIAIFRPSNGQWWLNRSTAGVIAFAFGVASDRPVQGDYTGDGKTDGAFWRPSTGEWFVLRSEDFSYYAVPFGTTGDVPVPGDYDGDGRFDTSVFRPSNTNWYINRTTSGLLIQQFGQGGDTPVPSAFVP